MMRSTASLSLHFVAVICCFATIAPPVGAASIPAYTVTDLGINNGYTLSDPGATGTLTTSTGAVYAFPRTDNSVADPQSLFARFPAFTNAPLPSLDGPTYSYFDSTGVFLNKAGDFVATNFVGTDGNSWMSASFLDTATRQANGSFSPITTLTSTDDNNYSGGQVARALDLNNVGQILGVDAGANTPYASANLYRDFFLYNLNTGVRTELTSLLPAGWNVGNPYMAIDDQGRILVDAYTYVFGQDSPDHLLLLTPAGLSSNPIPAPEPSILAVAGLGLAARRWRKA